MALFNLSNTASATDVTNINTQITGINSDITGINSDITGINSDITTLQGKTNRITDTGAGIKVAGTLQSTGAITSGNDITAFGSVS